MSSLVKQGGGKMRKKKKGTIDEVGLGPNGSSGVEKAVLNGGENESTKVVIIIRGGKGPAGSGNKALKVLVHGAKAGTVINAKTATLDDFW